MGRRRTWRRLGLGALLLAAILVPFFLWEQPITAWTERLVATPRAKWTVALGLGGLLAADVVLPVPSSLVNTAVGSLLGFPLGTLVAWAGMTLGSALGFRVGRGAARAGLGGVLGAEDARRAAEAFARYGPWALVLLRPVPVLAEASVVVAGFHGMAQRRFLLLCALSNLGIAGAYAAIGAFSVDVESFFVAFACAITLPALALLGVRGLRAARRVIAVASK